MSDMPEGQVTRLHRQEVERLRGTPLAPAVVPQIDLPEEPADPAFVAEWKLFRAEVGRLIVEGKRGHFALLKAGHPVSVWDTLADAVQASRLLYGNQPTLVQEIQPCLRSFRAVTHAMLHRKRLVLLLLLFTGLLVGGCAVAYYRLQPNPGVTLENFELLDRCTTLRDVENLMGCKAAEFNPSNLGCGKGPVGWMARCRTWCGDGIKIMVSFSTDDAVVQAMALSKDGRLLGLHMRSTRFFPDRLRTLLHV